MKSNCYFPHDSNARNDKNIVLMLQKYGLAGYGLYWVIIEAMREETELELPFEACTSIAYATHSEELWVKNFVEDCIKAYNLFDTDGAAFWSNSLIRRMYEITRRSQKNSENASVRWDKSKRVQTAYESDATLMPASFDMHALKESKVNQSKEKESNMHAVAGERAMWFEEIWKQYPNKVGRKEAVRHFLHSVKTPQDFEDIKRAITIYLATERVQKGYTQNGSTWFNNWRDWLEYKEPVRISNLSKLSPASDTTAADAFLRRQQDDKKKCPVCGTVFKKSIYFCPKCYPERKEA